VVARGQCVSSAYVCVRLLRLTGCELPVELWLSGDPETEPPVRRSFEPWDVTWLAAGAPSASEARPSSRFTESSAKASSVLHCRFAEVLLLSAVNVPVADPTSLFGASPYVRTGAVFWPDENHLTSDRALWPLTGVRHRDEPAFETGQMLLDKRRCWAPLWLAARMCERADFWFPYSDGDRGTFQIAWRRLAARYAMVPCPPEPLDGTRCHHDFAGRRIFQHRDRHPFRIAAPNPRIPGFRREAACLALLGELVRRTDGTPFAQGVTAGRIGNSQALADEIALRPWTYHRVGHDRRAMTFSTDGRVFVGAAACERRWTLRGGPGGWTLVLSGRDGVTCELRPDAEGWSGRWQIHECMPVRLVAGELPGEGRSMTRLSN
jgi:hypothetical protein